MKIHFVAECCLSIHRKLLIYVSNKWKNEKRILMESFGAIWSYVAIMKKKFSSQKQIQKEKKKKERGRKKKSVTIYFTHICHKDIMCP